MCCLGLGAYAGARWLRASLGSATKTARTAGFCSLCCVWGLFRADFRAIGRDRLMPFRISAGRAFEHCRGRIPNATQRAKTSKKARGSWSRRGPSARSFRERFGVLEAGWAHADSGFAADSRVCGRKTTIFVAWTPSVRRNVRLLHRETPSHLIRKGLGIDCKKRALMETKNFVFLS